MHAYCVATPLSGRCYAPMQRYALHGDATHRTKQKGKQETGSLHETEKENKRQRTKQETELIQTEKTNTTQTRETKHNKVRLVCPWCQQ